jgi:hypothetical protein
MDVLSEITARHGAAFGFLGTGSGELVLLRDGDGNVQVEKSLRNLSGHLAGVGVTIEYLTRQFAVDSMAESGLQALIVPPKLTMGDVRTAAVGRPLPPKSTRFVLPARALHLNLPLSMLKSGDREGFHDFLRNNTVYRVKGPVTLDRPYCEPWLYLLREPRTGLGDVLLERVPPGRIA